MLDDPNLEGEEYSYLSEAYDLCKRSLVTSFLGLIGEECEALTSTVSLYLDGDALYYDVLSCETPR